MHNISIKTYKYSISIIIIAWIDCLCAVIVFVLLVQVRLSPWSLLCFGIGTKWNEANRKAEIVVAKWTHFIRENASPSPTSSYYIFAKCLASLFQFCKSLSLSYVNWMTFKPILLLLLLFFISSHFNNVSFTIQFIRVCFILDVSFIRPPNLW